MRIARWFCVAWGGQFRPPFEVSSKYWAPAAYTNQFYPFEGSLSICTWNSRGLFTVDLNLCRDKLEVAFELAARHDILVIQEAHCGKDYHIHFGDKVKQTHTCWWSATSDDSATGGIGICVKRNLLHQFATSSFRTIEAGRIASLFLDGLQGRLEIFCVHLDFHTSAGKRVQQIQKIAKCVRNPEECHSLLAGDWNFDLETTDRFEPKTAEFIGKVNKDADWWNRLLHPILCEWHQEDYTRSGGHGQPQSRLDRIYSTFAIPTIVDMRLYVSIDPKWPSHSTISDHKPVCARFGPICATGPFPKPIPLWVTKHASWPKFVLDHLGDTGTNPNLDIWTRLHCTKTAFRKAADDIINISAKRGAQTSEEKLYWSIRALRGIRNGHVQTVQQACGAWPEIRIILGNTDATAWDSKAVSALKQRVSVLAKLYLEERLKQQHEARALPEYEVKRRQQRLQRLLQQWVGKLQKSSLSGIRGPDGNRIDDINDAADSLTNHWQTVFDEKPIDENLARQFLQLWAVKLPEIDWCLTFEEFEATLRNTNDTSPGPDGLPYCAWRNAPAAAVRILYEGYRTWIRDGLLPNDFNFSFLAVLPKGSESDDSAGISRAPDATRPLSLGNTDAKIFALMIKVKLDKMIGDWASLSQRGFIQGRLMLENILDTETWCVQQSVTTRTAALLLFDFSAAFPSLGHKYLWMILEACGIPNQIIRAIQALYGNNLHWLKYAGSLFRSFIIRSGVKQGGPLSAPLFVIAVDTILRT